MLGFGRYDTAVLSIPFPIRCTYHESYPHINISRTPVFNVNFLRVVARLGQNTNSVRAEAKQLAERYLFELASTVLSFSRSEDQKPE